MSVLIVALIVVVPATFVAECLISEAGKGAIIIQAQVEGGAWRRPIDAHQWIAPIDQWMERKPANHASTPDATISSKVTPSTPCAPALARASA